MEVARRAGRHRRPRHRLRRQGARRARGARRASTSCSCTSRRPTRPATWATTPRRSGPSSASTPRCCGRLVESAAVDALPPVLPDHPHAVAPAHPRRRAGAVRVRDGRADAATARARRPSARPRPPRAASAWRAARADGALPREKAGPRLTAGRPARNASCLAAAFRLHRVHGRCCVRLPGATVIEQGHLVPWSSSSYPTARRPAVAVASVVTRAEPGGVVERRPRRRGCAECVFEVSRSASQGAVSEHPTDGPRSSSATSVSSALEDAERVTVSAERYVMSEPPEQRLVIKEGELFLYTDARGRTSRPPRSRRSGSTSATRAS